MALTATTYEEDTELCRQFLSTYEPPIGKESTRVSYTEQMQRIANRQEKELKIYLDDVLDFNEAFGRAIIKNTQRYIKLFADAYDTLEYRPTEELSGSSVLDVFIQHRMALLQSNLADGETVDIRKHYPPSLLRRYDVVFEMPSLSKPMSIRQVESKHLGGLVRVEGIVTRVTAVKPKVAVATYACDQCGSEIYQEITSPTFMPLTQCTSGSCSENKQKGKLHLLTRGSKMVKFQEIRLQELSKHVPTGSIPRSMTVYAHGECTRQANPGDQVTITGVFLPIPYTGYRAIRAGLQTDTYVDAHTVVKAKKNYDEQVLTDEMREQIEEHSQQPDIYDRLASSIAPEIFGHEDVKKALLLLMVGGVDRVLADGMKIRGDINICLMGDPGVAKSQLLKKVADLAPRAVYTTGRGSSGVGLTAAVLRDPVTNELVLEGGALVLADNGICCIDEFDKMEDADRAAIHEVMEQQTISIAKAGITTTLNARAAVLAAANPLYGRYNIKRTATQNINLPASLLSRFDLLFLLLDRPNLDADLRLAQHITYVHTHNDFPELDHEPLEKEFMRNYVAIAKSFEPYIAADLVEYIAGVYVTMRQNAQDDTEVMTHTTARSILAVLRLASALARLRFSDEIVRDDVDEALRLMEMSRASLLEARQEKRRYVSPVDEIYKIICDMVQGGRKSVSLSDARQRSMAKGFTDAQFNACLDQYEDLNVWSVNTHRTKLTML